MEVKKEYPQSNFKPFSLTITISSEEEAKALYAIFNKTNNTDLIGENNGKDIRTAIGREYYVGSKNDGCCTIANGITYKNFYQG